MPSVSKKQVFVTSSPDASFLYNRLWMSNSAPPGQVLVAQLDPATDSTKLLSLEAKSLRSYLGFGLPPDGTVDGARPIFACHGEPQLGADVLCIPRGEERDLLHRLGRDEGGLGLRSVLTNHQEENDLHESVVLRRNFGRSQFRIVSPGQEPGLTSGDIYFSVDPELYTPDGQHPFRGIWMWELESGKFEFLLLHQESEHRLELVKLTGAAPVPNGSTSIVARDIRTMKRCNSESDDEWKWNNVRIVDAKIQGSNSVGGDAFFLDVELALVSDREIVVLLPEEYGNVAMQLKRVVLDTITSTGELEIPDCCRCSDDGNRANLNGWTVSGDAEVLRLGGGRGAVLSAFETPSTMPRQDGAAMHEICRFCQCFLSQVQLKRKPSATLLPPTSQHRLHESVKRLRSSAASGCHLCSLINYSLTAARWLDGNELKGVYVLYTCFEGDGRKRAGKDSGPVPPLEKPAIYVSLHPTGESLDTFFKPGVSPLDWYKFRSIGSNENEARPSEVPHRAVTRLETSSRAHMNLARGWLDQCSTHHESCRQRDPNFVPTRLLDVSGPTIRLTLTDPSDPTKYTNYCCLSHCWGGVTDIPLLKTDTLTSFLSQIDVTTLPRTFQDAILITRQLHIQYLWIDSLCIIQNSVDDWTKEAAVMGNIYQNGYCTISAAEAPSGHSGCFVRRNPLNCNAVRVARFRNSEMLFQPSEYPQIQISKSGYRSTKDIPAPRLQMMDVFTSKLASRGWVFQEALLSPRILYFGKGLFWNCKAGQASELDPLGRGMLHQGMYYGAEGDAIFRAPVEVSREELARSRGVEKGGGKTTAVVREKTKREGKSRSKVHDQVFFLFSGGRALGLGSPGRAEYNAVCDLAAEFGSGGMVSTKKFHREWMRLVAIYSRLQLTFEGDRLPALAGIAQTAISLAGDVLKGQYIAGMWRCTIVFDLLWSQGFVGTLDGYGPRPRGDENQCPSWSWASIGGAVESFLATWGDDWPAGMQQFVEVVSITADYDPLDPTRTGKVTGGQLVLEGLLIPCRTEVKSYSYTDTVEVQLLDEEGRHIGEAIPDTDPYEFVDGATFAVPFLSMEQGKSNGASLYGLVLVRRKYGFARVANWRATSSKDEPLDMSRYSGLKKTITVK